MEKSLRELEALLDQLNQPEILDDESLQTLPSRWEAAVASLVNEGAEHSGGGESNDPYRRRLENIVRRIPEVEERLQGYRSRIGGQLVKENRRFQAVKQTLKAYGAVTPFTHRKV